MTVIEIAQVRPPSEPRKPGHVVDASGASFEAWPEKLAKLQVGQRYAVEIEEREWHGRPIRKIGHVKSAEQSAADRPATLGNPALAEQAFVARVLGAGVISGQVKFDPAELTRATRMLQMLWGQSFNSPLSERGS